MLDLLTRLSLHTKEAGNYTSGYDVCTLYTGLCTWTACASQDFLQRAPCNPTSAIAVCDSGLAIHHCHHAGCSSRVPLIYLSRENGVIPSWFLANPTERKKNRVGEGCDGRELHLMYILLGWLGVKQLAVIAQPVCYHFGGLFALV